MNIQGAKKLFVTQKEFKHEICCLREEDNYLVGVSIAPDGSGGSDLTFDLRDGSIIGPINVPSGSQTISFSNPDLSISGGNTVDISDVNYWDELAGNLTYVSGNVGVGTIPFVPAHDFHVQGDTQLEGDVYDVDGLYTVGQVLTATVGGVRWQSPVLGVDTFDIGGDSGANVTVVASDLADFVGSGGIQTTVSKVATTIILDIALQDTAVTPATYGSSSQVASITVDQQGRITAASNVNIDHGSISGLADDDHTQYALLAGRSTGQTLIGGTDASDDLVLRSTSNTTKGDVIVEGLVLAEKDDPTKQVNLNLTAITTATQRTWTVPDRDLDFSVGGTFAEESHTHSGLFTWTEVTVTSAAMSSDNGYITNNAGLVTLTLPPTSTQGDRIIVTGRGAGGWRITQNAGQTIYFGNTSTTTGATGYIESDHHRDTITLVCVANNTEWNAYASQGANLIVN